MNSEAFLKNHYMPAIRSIAADQKPMWGLMDTQNMVEHMADAFRNANGKIVYTGILTQEERIPKMQEFIMSDKEFKENTKNLLLPDQPLPHRHGNLDDALAELNTEVNDFLQLFDRQPELIIRNPFFGDLDFEHWKALLVKHALHHLRQFGVKPDL